MGLVLRIVGGFWILYLARPVFGLVREVLFQGLNVHFDLSDFLHVAMLTGGIGLLCLREWGRWILLLGCAAFLVLAVGPSLLQLRFSPHLIRPLVFYGLFIVILALPRSRSATRK